MKKLVVLEVVCSILILGGIALAVNNRPVGGHPIGLLDYQVNTIRAKRIEIMDDEWRIRMVLDVHEGRSVVTFFNESGEPAKVISVPDAGLILGE